LLPAESKSLFADHHSGKGALAGAVIDGAKLTARDSVNLDLYGADALALLSDPSQLPNMCAACVDPSLSDFPQTASPALAPQPLTTMREDLASKAPAPHSRSRGVKVIVIKIINEDDEDDEDDEDIQVVAVRPQLQPAPAVICCPRIHKKKL
jgi:hypothetical protein